MAADSEDDGELGTRPPGGGGGCGCNTFPFSAGPHRSAVGAPQPHAWRLPVAAGVVAEAGAAAALARTVSETEAASLASYRN